MKFSKLILALSILTLVSCAGEYGTLTTGYYKQAAPTDPEAKYGAFATLSDKAKDKLIPEPIVDPAK